MPFNIETYFSPEKIVSLIRVALLLFIGFPLIYFVGRWFRKYIGKRSNAQRGLVFEKLILYFGTLILIITLLKELGFELTPLLGAAGIIGIAIGFASQTSVSNIISGLFLIIEKPFAVNDIIQINKIMGQVLSIDTLSVKLRTFDNCFVRIPNETIIKTEVINLTYFPIRRVDVSLRIPYRQDIESIKKALLSLPANNPLCLQQPRPKIVFDMFSSAFMHISLYSWTAKENYRKVYTGMGEAIQQELKKIGIEYPEIVISSGEEGNMQDKLKFQ